MTKDEAIEAHFQSSGAVIEAAFADLASHSRDAFQKVQQMLTTGATLKVSVLVGSFGMGAVMVQVVTPDDKTMNLLAVELGLDDTSSTS